LRQTGKPAAVPIICIGNLTVGGAGKTPAAITLAHLLRAEGETPVFLTRGYGGRLPGPVCVDAARHGGGDVGDEALLLARQFTAIVARDRPAGATMAVAAGASVIVMDDGFQNPSLIKDVSVLVVDAGRGIGNGRVLPAGPLRAPLSDQMAKAHALLIVGEGEGASQLRRDAQARGLPVFSATLEPDRELCVELRTTRVLAFAGIGDPDKFFATLDKACIDAPIRRNFADHHHYTAADAATLLEQANMDGLTLLTTEKDLARMQGDPALDELRARSKALPVSLAFHEFDKMKQFLRERIKKSC
jgi:tetraacyldisaccharide 4'-kinase